MYVFNLTYLSNRVGRAVCIENLQIHLSVVVVCMPCRIEMFYFGLSVSFMYVCKHYTALALHAYLDR
jgi:hypothetical protein